MEEDMQKIKNIKRKGKFRLSANGGIHLDETVYPGPFFCFLKAIFDK